MAEFPVQLVTSTFKFVTLLKCNVRSYKRWMAQSQLTEIHPALREFFKCRTIQ